MLSIAAAVVVCSEKGSLPKAPTMQTPVIYPFISDASVSGAPPTESAGNRAWPLTRPFDRSAYVGAELSAVWQTLVRIDAFVEFMRECIVVNSLMFVPLKSNARL